jgi:O-acetyl-ADP-ribose deacetylase (regulator of RNase III)
MLNHVTGNLIDMAEQGQFDVIVHGCNCLNTMGSGIALEIRTRYPKAYEADTLATQQWKTPVAKLGNFSTYSTIGTGNPFVIVNAYTQLNYAPRGIDHFEYESFSLILRKLEALGPVRFGFPYIGMGLAGGDETRIIKMLTDFADRVTALGGSVTLVEFQGS